MSHRARLDLSAPVLRAVTGWIAWVRRRPWARPWQRATTVHTQVLRVRRWLRYRIDLHTLVVDVAISDATAYRYLHEALDVIATHPLTSPKSTPRRTPLARPTCAWTAR